MPYDVAPHNMTSNTAPWPYVASCSSTYGGGYDAWLAFNGVSNNSGWVSASGWTSGWLQIRLPRAFCVVSYTLVTRWSAAENPKDWTILGSQDGASWTEVDRQTGQTGWTHPSSRSYVVANPGTFLFYRIAASSNNGDSYVAIGELYLYADEIPVGLTASLKKRFLGTEPPSVLPPAVSAGPDQYVVVEHFLTQPLETTLAGVCAVSCVWSKVWGPGTVTFTDDTSPTTGVEFSLAGAYRLRLTADDGVNTKYSEVVINVIISDSVVAQVAVEVANAASATVRDYQLVVEVSMAHVPEGGETSMVWMGDGGGAVWIE